MAIILQIRNYCRSHFISMNDRWWVLTRHLSWSSSCPSPWNKRGGPGRTRHSARAHAIAPWPPIGCRLMSLNDQVCLRKWQHSHPLLGRGQSPVGCPDRRKGYFLFRSRSHSVGTSMRAHTKRSVALAWGSFHWESDRDRPWWQWDRWCLGPCLPLRSPCSRRSRARIGTRTWRRLGLPSWRAKAHIHWRTASPSLLGI